MGSEMCIRDSASRIRYYSKLTMPRYIGVKVRHMLRFQTAGESHGQGLVAILQGLPAGLRVDFDYVNRELKRRQGGYGRGGRMKIETDTAQFLAGVRHGQTIGSPIAVLIVNRDWENWKEAMAVEDRTLRPVATDRRNSPESNGPAAFSASAHSRARRT